MRPRSRVSRALQIAAGILLLAGLWFAWPVVTSIDPANGSQAMASFLVAIGWVIPALLAWALAEYLV